MSNPLVAFVDSDVVISSLISPSGAAYFLLHQSNLKLFISDISYKEMCVVIDRLKLDQSAFDKLIKKDLKLVKLTISLPQIKKKYFEFVSDPNDAHIVAGAEATKGKFLISYNLKHFKIDKIKSDLGIILTTPARFLQYLRST